MKIIIFSILSGLIAAFCTYHQEQPIHLVVIVGVAIIVMVGVYTDVWKHKLWRTR